MPTTSGTPILTKATARFIRTSPRKARLVADLVRGKNVAEALAILQYSPQAAARLIDKVLRSAIANAEHNHQVRSLDDLRVGAVIDGGPSLKRIQPRAMGRAFWIRHRLSHITVTLSAAPAEPAARAPAPRSPRTGGRGVTAKPAPAKTAAARPARTTRSA